MTVTHTRSVILTVRDDNHNATFSREQEHHWPGALIPHITDLIREVCDEMIEEILKAEAEE